ncbi:probable dolichyl pyrophosphate Man9GlcNAc2 alpha-1,3-glucosyltransferase [Drosophila serrata]|uniref:probable dolichyl pyrophosphate Man9GlcNAc2 alpha-1,3-glucosyltransferase n=1 Tax=Drosophila serrata TaxID=7274 RepID=UPI000A1D36DB|nr:probable dolichyl pyrophosphate Man9GlcNAc2 alpha-1,3-glucosyltransferase [Drosophila serrata]
MKSEILAAAFVGLAVRSIISLYSYSGFNTPPMHGDYEAQRHWQEVTVNLDVGEWYTNSSNNDLMYWGLDYPPLTAYHSYIVGRIAKAVDPRFVELHKSRGFQSLEHKRFMRSTVVAADVLCYLPALLTVCLCLDKSLNDKLFLFILMVAYPGQILIDNGHFQYNNISLGLAAAAVAAILRGRLYIASFFFTLALNYKQMELYHSLPFFVFLWVNV